METRVTAKGRVTIPKAIRDRLKIRPGDAVTFELVADGRIVLAKARGSRSAGRLAALRGRADRGLSTDEVMALTRGAV